MRPQSHVLLALTAALAFASSASAAAVATYADAAAFQSTLEPGSYLETFDSLSGELPSTLAFSSAGFSFTASAPQGLYTGVGDTGSRFLGLNTATDTLTITFTGDTPTALGGYFFNTSISDNLAAGNVTLTLSDGTTYSFNSPGASPFVGFTSGTATPITSLTIHTTTTTSVWPSLDSFVVGHTAIPEPSTYALGAGVLAVGFALWRRRR